MQGRNRCSARQVIARSSTANYLIGMRDRLDSRYEMVRTVRDQRFRYQRNYYPHLPFKPHEDFEFNAPVLKKWVELARAGEAHRATGPCSICVSSRSRNSTIPKTILT